MKKKYLIAGTVVVIAVIAAVVLLLLNNSNNNSEFRIQNSELNAENVSTAVPSTDIKEVPVLTAEPENTEAPSALPSDRCSLPARGRVQRFLHSRKAAAKRHKAYRQIVS